MATKNVHDLAKHGLEYQLGVYVWKGLTLILKKQKHNLTRLDKIMFNKTPLLFNRLVYYYLI